MGEQGKKICFVIAPIGAKGGEVRQRSDLILKHVIAPAVDLVGYKALRADAISEPGMITAQVIQHLLEDPLVVADLTDHNPNVFYELAIRHAVQKPIVQMIQSGQRIPFDVVTQRTIEVDHQDLDNVEECKGELQRQIRAVEKNSGEVDSPITVALNLQSLRRSEDPLKQTSAQMIAMLQDITNEVRSIGRGQEGSGIEPECLDMCVRSLEELAALLDVQNGDTLTRDRLNMARISLFAIAESLHRMVAEGHFPRRFAAMVRDRIERIIRRA